MAESPGGSFPLGMLRKGDTALVREVCGDVQLVHRLNEIGLRQGCVVQMLQPGKPCIIRLGNTRYGVRDSDLFQVMVSLDNTS